MTEYKNFAVRPVAYKKLDKIIKVSKRTKMNEFEILVDNEYIRLGLDKEDIQRW